MIQNERIKRLNEMPVIENENYVLYWMQAAVRTEYNHALEYSIELANRLKKPLFVFFGVTENYPEANLRHFYFLLESIADVKTGLNKRKIGFICRLCEPADEAVKLSSKACAVVCDRGYLAHQKLWRIRAASEIKKAVFQVETDAVVPVNEVSDKEEFAARTLRPKITGLLEKFLIAPRVNKIDIASDRMILPLCGGETGLKKHDNSINIKNKYKEGNQKNQNNDNGINDIIENNRGIDLIINKMKYIDRSVFKSPYFTGGENTAKTLLEEFIEIKLGSYHIARNEPKLDNLSKLSPYLHFGNISPIYAALKVKSSKSPVEAVEKFLEELIVRRELSFNFCEYNENYGSSDCLPEWSVKTLDGRSKDERPYIYSQKDFEFARTHDHCWNAAQLEMVVLGKMHNYMRMYWGKKIIEWTPDYKTAYKIILYLNNKYSLDGRDPNSFAGAAWCFGKHDRPWTVRPVFGSIRYMNEAGLKRKFDMNAYIEKIANICADNNYKLDSLTHLMEEK